MKLTLQKGIDPHTDEPIWLILDDNYQVVEPIQRYLTFISSKSPNTVEAYGYDLKAWWQFLHHKHLDWRNVQIQDLADFAHWLRLGDTSNVVSAQPVTALRSERSVNRAITAVTTFYEYHIASKGVDFKQFDRFFLPIGLGTKRLLKGIAKSKPNRKKLVKLKEPKKFPGCLTNEQIEILASSCSRLRDKLIILMLNGTGVRKGELLGLRHEDLGDFGDNYIKVVKRLNQNGARAKGQERRIPVSKDLIEMYNDYLIYEYPEVHTDYVFVNIWEGKIGAPMNPKVLNIMFERLSKKTEIEVYPHLLRHTYATRLLKAKYPFDRVSYLLGHTSIQTTLDIYSHIIQEDVLSEVIRHEEGK
jgi:site-specific recombinase XerD